MNGLLLLVAAAATGGDVGWQPLAGGGYEYIIQIEPQALAAMEQGRDLVSDLPPQLRDVRRYRITIGTGPVPRIGTPPEMTDPASVNDNRSTQSGTGPQLPAPPSTNDPFAGNNRTGAGSYGTNDGYNSGSNTYPAGGGIGVTDPRLGAATGLAAPLPSRLPISDPYGTDRYPTNSGTNSGQANNNSNNNQNSGNLPSNQQGTGYNNDPRTNLPTAGPVDPFYDRGYGNTQTSNLQDPRLQPGGNVPMNPAYPQGTGYQNPANPQGGNTLNWPTAPQNAIPSTPMPPANYGVPMGPPANYNVPPQGNPAGYNQQPPFNNQPPANYNPPAANNTPTTNWPTNTLADNSRNSSSTGNQIPKPFLDEDELPRASFHSGAEGDKATPTPQWFPFTMALLMLFVSLGGNAYLGWIALTLRNKYLALLEKLRRRMKI